jgi:hypothetical protein
MKMILYFRYRKLVIRQNRRGGVSVRGKWSRWHIDRYYNIRGGRIPDVLIPACNLGRLDSREYPFDIQFRFAPEVKMQGLCRRCVKEYEERKAL